MINKIIDCILSIKIIAFVSIAFSFNVVGAPIIVPLSISIDNLGESVITGGGTNTGDPGNGSQSGNITFSQPVAAAGMLAIDKAIIWGASFWHPAPLAGATPLSDSANNSLAGSMIMDLGSEGIVTGAFDFTNTLMDISLDFQNLTGSSLPPDSYQISMVEDIASLGPGQAFGQGSTFVDGILHGTFEALFSFDGNPTIEIDPIRLTSNNTVSLSGNEMTFVGTAQVQKVPAPATIWLIGLGIICNRFFWKKKSFKSFLRPA